MSTTLEHTQCLESLPALVGGTLDPVESAAALAHAGECAECVVELQFARRLHTHFARQWHAAIPLLDDTAERANFDRLWAQITDDPAAPSVPTVPRSIRRAWTSTLAAIAATLLVGVGYVWYRSADAPQFRTLADSMRTCDILRVRVAPQSEPADVRRLFESAGARLVDGPTADGSYTLSAPNSADVLVELRKLPVVQLAEAKPC